MKNIAALFFFIGFTSCSGGANGIPPPHAKAAPGTVAFMGDSITAARVYGKIIAGIAGGEFGIGFLALDYLAFYGYYEFAAGLFGFGVGFGLRFLVEDDLDYAGAVADVEEEQVA